MRSFTLSSVNVGQVNFYEYITVSNKNYFNFKYHVIQSVVLRNTKIPQTYNIFCLKDIFYYYFSFKPGVTVDNFTLVNCL